MPTEEDGLYHSLHWIVKYGILKYLTNNNAGHGAGGGAHDEAGQHVIHCR